VQELRKTRDADAVNRALDRIRDAARGTENMVYSIFDAVKGYATLGEICDALRDVFGEYTEPEIV
jgi:methylmalonyl-CoA mutase N-terminal domain/subunit